MKNFLNWCASLLYAAALRGLLILVAHLPGTVAGSLGPGGVKFVVADRLLAMAMQQRCAECSTTPVPDSAFIATVAPSMTFSTSFMA